MRKLLLPLLAFIILFYSCQSETVTTTNAIAVTDIESMTIKALPSPPKMKTIDKKEDIEKVIKHINSINKEKIKQEDVGGWVFLIQTKGSKEHSISFVGGTMNIDGSWYKVNADEVTKFRDIYNSLNYKEESVVK